MKTTLNEEIQNFKRLTTEATTTASSGPYEVPMGFDVPNEEPVCVGDTLTGSEVSMEAPEVDVVDITDSSDDIVIDFDEVFNSLGMFENTTKKLPIKEDSEGEETYHYGEDEGHDKYEEMSMQDHVKEIEKHLKHLKDDMGYDEDHEDRDEKGTKFD